MKAFLLEQAKDYIHQIETEMDWYPLIEGYSENINADVLDGTWLKKRTSFIWKVAALTLFDGNKRDFGRAYLGMQKKPDDAPVLIGVLEFAEGEGDDCGRVMRRLLSCMERAELCFEQDQH